MKTIALFSTSTRKGSYNQKLVECAARELNQENRVQVELIDLSLYEMPLFHGELAIPEAVQRLYAKLSSCHGWVIASCEYNASFSPLIKNTIDWLSLIKDAQGTPLFHGKNICLMSASPGSLGGLRGVLSLQPLLWQLGARVLGSPLSVPLAHQAFDEGGHLKDDSLKKRMGSALKSLVTALEAQ
jgi:chromate reductase